MSPLLAQCHTGGCTQEMSSHERRVAELAKQQADDWLMLALGIAAVGFLWMWGRQFERDRRLFRE